MKEPEKTKNLVDKLINEPTVHFFVISVVVFIVYAISNLNGDDVIELDQREIAVSYTHLTLPTKA